MTTATARPEVLAHVQAVLEELTAQQLEDLAAGRGRLVFHAETGPRGRRAEPARPAGFDADAAVAEINMLDRPGAVADYLRRRRFTVPMLREIARALGPTVPTTGRSKEEVIRDIVEGTAGFRIRSAAMSGGAWG